MDGMMEGELAHLQQWVGRCAMAEDEAALPTVQRLAGLLDRDPARFRRGDPLPESWHSVLFGPATPQSGLGPDGHPSNGEFLPPIPLPRRMFAGRRVRFLTPLLIGATIRRTSTVAAVIPKAGRTGPMVFVRVDHVIASDKGDAIREEQDIVYRGEGGADMQRQESPEAAATAEQHREAYEPDEVALFRYSALCFNAHRIHYDLPYARGEGYPGLVVNGGLTALRLAELAKRLLPGNRLGRLAVRNVRPFFAGRRGELVATAGNGTVELRALDEEGRVVARAEAAGRDGSP